MRILYVIDSFSPAIGGPPEAVRQLIKATRATGAQVEAVCLDHPEAEFLSDLGCPVHALDQSFLGSYAFSPRLWRWLRSNAGRFDGMIMNGVWTFPGLALRSAARGGRRPYGIFVHGALDPWFNRRYPLKHLKKLCYWPLQYAVLRDAAAVFFTTRTERDLATTSFRPNHWKSVIAALGIAEDVDAGQDPAREIEAFYGVLPELRGQRFLLFLARLHEKKGCDLLIEAFARVVALAPEVQLVVAGPDQVGMQAKLKSRAEQLGIAARVHWPGMIGGEVKWGALRTCEALVLPSHQENFGVSVAEALSAGRPVLLSFPVNIWPEIENDGVGLADDDTLEGTVRLLERWFGLPAAEQAAMAARAQPCFAARFSMERTAATINEVFGSVKHESA
jgi:glycosyltransferase involved in cell wall biosynthesis